MTNHKPPSTSWEESSDWYAACVGEKGHYYHQTLIFPGLLRLLDRPRSLLDLGCGVGAFASVLPHGCFYYGVDASPSLIQEAKKRNRAQASYLVADVTEPLSLEKSDFDAATFILSLQNMENAAQAIQNACNHLRKGGDLLLVLNHPCFRIPRQTSWGIDTASKLQYRRINRYLSPLRIPIQMHPSQKEGAVETLSFHTSLSGLMQMLFKVRYAVVNIEEWCSPKKSTGLHARREDLARREIPLFLTLVARRIN